MLTAIRRIWAELMRPSTLPPGPLDSAYRRGVIGTAHALLGAGLVAVLGPLWGIALRGAVGVVYFLTKEIHDIRVGGTVWDSVEDTAMVGLGAWFWPAWWWPIMALGFGGMLMISGALRHG